MPRLALACGLVPVAMVVGLDPDGWYPFGPAKWLTVSVTLGVVVTVMCRHAASPGAPWRWPRRPMLLWAGLIAWLSIAAAVGADRWYAWTGTPERHLGVITWILFAAAFLAGAQLTTVGDVRTLCRGVIIAGLLCGAYCVVELVAGRPVELAVDTRRLGGPFGSAAYLGAAICLLLPIAAGVAADRTWSRPWRTAATIAAASCAVGLIGSGSRAAWVGMAVAAIAASVAVRRASPSQPAGQLPSSRRRFGWRPVAAVLVVTAVAVGLVAPRLGDVVDRSHPATSRIDEWAVGVRALTHSPVLGVGPEGYRVEAGRFVDAHYERTYGDATIPDRAHDGPLDVGLAGGVPAALLYVALLATVLAAAWRVARQRDVTSTAVALAVVGFVAAQLLLFPVAEIDPLLWLLAGMTWARSRPIAIAPVAARHRRATAGTVAGACFTAVALITGSLDVAADRLAARAARAGGLDDVRRVELARRATDLRPDVVRYRLLLAAARTTTLTLADVDAAIHDVDAARWISPGDPIARRQRAGYLGLRADITGDAGDAQRAAEALQQVVDGSPHCRPCASQLEQALDRLGRAP